MAQTKIIKISVKRFILVIMLSCIMVSSTVGYLAYAAASDYYQVITGGKYPGAPSFTIYEQDSVYYAKNAWGGISYSDIIPDTVIQSAINALPETGGEIRFSAQNFVLDSGFTVPDDVFSVLFSGEGQQRTRLDGQSLTEYAVTVQGGGITFEHMSIYGGVKVTSCDTAYFEDCYFDRAGAAKYNLLVDGTSPVYSLTLNKCKLLSDASLGNIYAYVPNLSGAEISNVLVIDCEIDWGTANSVSFINQRDNSLYLRGCKVSQSYLEAGTGSAIYSYNTNGLKIINNDIYGTSDTTEPLIELDGDSSVRTYRPLIQGNNIIQFSSTAANGIYANNVYDLALNNNNIDGQTYDLQIGSGSARSRITANYFMSGLVSIAGSNHTVNSNQGFVIENSGYATMTAYSSVVVIPHGINGIPNVRLASGSNAEIRNLIPGTGTVTTFSVTNMEDGSNLQVTSDATIWWYAAINNSTMHP